MKIPPKAFVNSRGFDFTDGTTTREFDFLLLILITACLHFFKAQPDLPQTWHSPGCHSFPDPQANWQHFWKRNAPQKHPLDICSSELITRFLLIKYQRAGYKLNKIAALKGCLHHTELTCKIQIISCSSCVFQP